MTPMNFAYLIESEATTADEFRNQYASLTQTLGDVLDDIFRLAYFVEHPQASEDEAHWFCFERSVHAPYTLWTIYSLCEKGYYGEATVLLRHLLEIFVQIQYFRAHPEKIKRHLTATKRSENVKFKTMFDWCAPGSYERVYGNVLSNIAHGGIGLSAFISEFEQSSETRMATANVGCKFDRRASLFIVTQLLGLCFGFLNFFPLWFPGYAANAPNDVEQRRVTTCAALADYLKDPAGKVAKAREWNALFGLTVSSDT